MQEAVEELRLKKDKTFEDDDLLFERRTLEGLGNLYNSLVRLFLKHLANEAMVYKELERVETNRSRRRYVCT